VKPADMDGWQPFWRFVRERHRIYKRRQAGWDRPWTQEPILRDYFFTNVYRELDPGTVFIREMLQEHRDQPLRDKLFNTMLYRLAMRERSFAQLGWQQVAHFDVADVRRWLGQHDQPFHNAYNISNQGKSKPKHVVVANTAGDWLQWLPHDLPQEAQTREGFITWLRKARGVGPFLATQVLADLVYDQHVPLPRDGYVELGPGARRGLANIQHGPEHRDPLPASQAQEVLTVVCENQSAEHDGALPKALTRMNAQNCACEFSKWSRGGGRRRYHGPDQQMGLL